MAEEVRCRVGMAVGGRGALSEARGGEQAHCSEPGGLSCPGISLQHTPLGGSFPWGVLGHSRFFPPFSGGRERSFHIVSMKRTRLHLLGTYSLPAKEKAHKL